MEGVDVTAVRTRAGARQDGEANIAQRRSWPAPLHQLLTTGSSGTLQRWPRGSPRPFSQATRNTCVWSMWRAAARGGEGGDVDRACENIAPPHRLSRRFHHRFQLRRMRFLNEIRTKTGSRLHKRPARPPSPPNGRRCGAGDGDGKRVDAAPLRAAPKADEMYGAATTCLVHT